MRIVKPCRRVQRLTTAPPAHTCGHTRRNSNRTFERYQAAQKALGRLFDIVFSICIEGVALKVYAARLRINPSAASGRLFAAMQKLLDHYDEITPKPEEKSPATIGGSVAKIERWSRVILERMR